MSPRDPNAFSVWVLRDPGAPRELMGYALAAGVDLPTHLPNRKKVGRKHAVTLDTPDPQWKITAWWLTGGGATTYLHRTGDST